MNDECHWRFDPLDTWFFKEARGFETSGHNELSSLFPPPARTVAGAIRTLIGEQQDVDWTQFPENYPELREQIGDGDVPGQLALTGPYPLWEENRLYPVPLHLLGKDHESGKDHEYRFLVPGNPERCDLGTVQLPCIAGTRLPGAKPLEGAWLHEEDLQHVLAGKPPKQVLTNADLFDEEPRLGIARDNHQRTVLEGLLYQTRHLRPRQGLAIGADTRGLTVDVGSDARVIRLGGEARPTAVHVERSSPPVLQPPPMDKSNLALILLTPADFDGHWCPPGFREAEREGCHVWSGSLLGISLTVHCAVIGKAVREGGWDLARQRPRPVRSLLPAGSVWFCTLEDGVQMSEALRTLHGAHIGIDTALGRGELAVGAWPSKGDVHA